MESFTPIAATIGGVLIGLSASLLLLLNGRIAGVSGIAAGLVSPRAGDLGWRVAFVLGLVAGGLATVLVAPDLFAVNIDRSWIALLVAGLFVGYGVRLGSGCTSGHGVCGVSRLSRRSLVATVTFIFTGAVTVAIVGRLLGGAL